MKCIICGNNMIGIGEAYDDRYGYKGLFPVFRCATCEHVQIEAKLTPDQILELYTNFYPRAKFDVEEYTPYKETKGFKAWLNGEDRSAYRWVPKNVRILDIGCGFAETLGYYKNRGCEVYGVEADENVRKVAYKFGFNIEIGTFDPSRYQEGFFNYVTMDQVIEHMQDPIKTLKDINGILEDRGKLIISTPNSSGWGRRFFKQKWINWHAPYHINLFSYKSIQIAAKKSGYKVLMISTKTGSEWLYYQFIHNILYPEQGEQSLFWCSKFNEVKIYKKIILGVIYVSYKMKVFHFITRIFDSINIGDNIITILEKNNGKVNNTSACS